MSRSKESTRGVQIEDKWYKEWVETNLTTDMKGKVAVITGSNSGIGFWAASALAGKNCTVVLACRSETKAEAAKKEILEKFPQAKLNIIPLDNMDFDSVRKFAKAFHDKYDRLDILCNNAGIMAQPRTLSKDGYDVQIQTNHLSHFLLTKLLWDKLINTEGQGRVVQVSSGAHWLGMSRFHKNKPDFATYSWGMGFFWYVFLPYIMKLPNDNWLRYCMSKLCNVLFFRELEWKIKEKGMEDKVISLACHPGYASTQLQVNAADALPGWEEMNKKNAQSAADGSLPLLMACVGKDVTNGDYIGPSLSNEQVGPPAKTRTGRNTADKKMAADLWEFSEEAVGDKFTI